MEGKVCRVCGGFFFVRGSDGYKYFGIFKDILEDSSGYKPTLHLCSRVEFDAIDEGEKHRRAVNIRVLQE